MTLIFQMDLDNQLLHNRENGLMRGHFICTVSLFEALHGVIPTN